MFLTFKIEKYFYNCRLLINLLLIFHSTKSLSKMHPNNENLKVGEKINKLRTLIAVRNRAC